MFYGFPWLKKTVGTLRGMMQLVLMTEIKQVFANTLIVRQNELCKFLYFIQKGNFTVIRDIEFIESLNCPIE
jgi:CRP-like cAMP-binding protein